MKNIAVLVFNLLSEYPSLVVSSICNFYKYKNDVRCVVAQIKTPNNNDGTFTYQQWNVSEFLKSDDIDAYIIVSGTYGGDAKKVMELLNTKHKPFISIGQNLDIDGSFYTVVDCSSVFLELVGHLKNVHGCKNIGFFSGTGSGSIEAQNREYAFFDALNAFDMDFKEENLYIGNFTRYSVRDIFEKQIKSKDDVHFDSVICANDFMAYECIEQLSKLGFRIPEDIKVIGFDDSYLSTSSKPSISSVNQSIELQGQTAAKIIYEVLSGVDIPECTPTSLIPKYRQSCGCVHFHDNTFAFKDSYGELYTFNTDGYSGQDISFTKESENFGRASSLFDIIHSHKTIEKFAEDMDFVLRQTDFNSISVCIFEEPVSVKPDEEFHLPKNMVYKMAARIDGDNRHITPNLKYDPDKNLFPGEYFNDISGSYFLYPIIAGENIYGYMLIRFEKRNFSFYELCMKIISAVLAQSIEYTISSDTNKELQEHNAHLRKQSLTDELTQIYNRRGFMEYGQRLLDFSTETGNGGLVFFGDLDGLKTINDKFGHEYGDIAIKTQAKIFQEVFRKSDICGRLSGDEFGAVLQGMKPSRLPGIRKEIDDAAKRYTEELKLPFELSISFGVVPYDINNYDLVTLLKAADKNLYEEKLKKHGEEYYQKLGITR